VAPGIPTRLRIPALGIDARTRPEGLVGGAPDVPANGVDAGWYMFGPRPGLAGNAVIDGHRDTTAGPAVFWRLRSAAPGERLYVTDGYGVVRTFQVVSVASYTLTQAPLRRIYGPSSEAHLNLITCDGTWVPAIQTYDHRLVVYASLVA
jgi:sortase A